MIKCSTAFPHLDRFDPLRNRQICSESISVFPPESIRVSQCIMAEPAKANAIAGLPSRLALWAGVMTTTATTVAAAAASTKWASGSPGAARRPNAPLTFGGNRTFQSKTAKFIRPSGRSAEQRHTPRCPASFFFLSLFSEQNIWRLKGTAAGGMNECKQKNQGKMAWMRKKKKCF